MDKRYKSSIPSAAEERIVERFADGSRRKTEYTLDDELVGVRFRNKQGQLEHETPLRDGRTHGVVYSFYFAGILTLAEPYENGRIHGTARQWSDDGRLIGTYTMVHGTGFDLWRGLRSDGSPYLAEVHSLQEGLRHGYEWWINEDHETVYRECHWFHGELHGVEREWNATGRLRRGYPKYYVHDRKVSKRDYLRACKLDPTLPVFRRAENAPRRRFPKEIRRAMQP